MKSEIRYLNGYRLLYRPEHKRAMHGSGYEGYVYEHIIVAEKSLGREMKNNEETHHLDTVRDNNNHENIIVLENSQHAKFHLWLRKVEVIQDKNIRIRRCKICGEQLTKGKSQYCSSNCLSIGYRKTNWPSKEELSSMLETMTQVEIGKKHNVSGNAVRNWKRKYGI